MKLENMIEFSNYVLNSGFKLIFTSSTIFSGLYFYANNSVKIFLTFYSLTVLQI